MPRPVFAAALASGLVALAATVASTASAPALAQGRGVPEVLRVPAGNVPLVAVTAYGDITWVCTDKDGRFEWVLKVPHANMYDADNNFVGYYYGSPRGATWENKKDGSVVVGKQLALAPNKAAGKDTIPLQLVQATVNEGNGAYSKVSYIQRLNTKGGKPTNPCNAAVKGRQTLVRYSADYHFFIEK